MQTTEHDEATKLDVMAGIVKDLSRLLLEVITDWQHDHSCLGPDLCITCKRINNIFHMIDEMSAAFEPRQIM